LLKEINPYFAATELNPFIKINTMKKFLFISIALTLVMTTAGCRKTKLTGDKALYEGYWTSSTTTLELMANGRGSYNYDDGVTTKSINNGRLIIQGSMLKIKLLVSKKYHIDSPPVTHTSMYGDTYTEMTLDGEVFLKN
jgi:hypothetical protein